MSLIQREIERIRASILSGDNSRHDELYAAQQALEWVLEPSGIKPPYAMIIGTQEGSTGYPAPSSPALCGCASDALRG